MSELHRISTNPSSNRLADIVFIHGINGDAFATWRNGKDESSSWPHWLSADYPALGVWSYTYAAAASRWASLILGGPRRGRPMRTADVARNALDCLIQQEIGLRPLMFVCHSYGGIVAKYVLRSAWDDVSSKSSKRLYENTRAMLFLDTPHSGSLLASLLTAFSFVARTSTPVTELVPGSDGLHEVAEWFKGHASALGIQCKGYREGRQSFGRLVVSRESASSGHEAISIPLEETHSSICKPRTRSAQVYIGARQLIESSVLVPRPIAGREWLSQAASRDNESIEDLRLLLDAAESGVLDAILRHFSVTNRDRLPGRLTAHERSAMSAAEMRAWILTELGSASLARGSPHDAVKHFVRAVDLRRDRVRESPQLDTRQHELAVSLNNLFQALLATDREADAQKVLEEEREVRRRLAGLALSTSIVGWERCVNQARIGKALLDAGDFLGAVENLKTAVGSMMRQLKTDKRTPEQRSDLGVAMVQLGDAYKFLGLPKKALHWYVKSLGVRLLMLRNHPSQVGEKHGLAICYARIGSVHFSQHDLRDAHDCYQHAVSIVRHTTQTDGSDGDLQRTLSYCLSRLCEAQEKMGDTESAWCSAKESNDIDEDWARRNPQDQRWLADAKESRAVLARLRGSVHDA